MLRKGAIIDASNYDSDMTLPHVFLLGPSGVGKSEIASYIADTRHSLHIEIDRWPEGDGIDLADLRHVWNGFVHRREAAPLSRALSDRASAAGLRSCSLSFPSALLLSVAHIEAANGEGIRVRYLYGSAADCMRAFLAREQRTARHLGVEHWVANNSTYFEISRPEFLKYRVGAFDEKGGHRALANVAADVLKNADSELPQPFWFVNGKLSEADFFLEKLRTAGTLDDARYYFSAFTSAARTVTFVLQASLRNVTGFEEWYEAKQAYLRTNAIAAYFHRIRNSVVHIGHNPLGRQMRGMFTSEFWLVGKDLPERDAVKAGAWYVRELVTIVFEAYGLFWSSLDIRPDMTLAHLAAEGRTLEDIEEELGVGAGWAKKTFGYVGEDALNVLKEISKTEIERLRRKYLNTT